MQRHSKDAPCRCGHTHAAHEHYRRGTDCALCICGRFSLLVASVAWRRRPWPARPRGGLPLSTRS